MEIHVSEKEFQFSDMDAISAGLIRMLPESAAVNDQAAHGRIYCAPTAGRDPEADQDWQENVEPELRTLFKSHVDAVVGDIGKIQNNEGVFSMNVPLEHARAWIHTLNQARLVLCARYNFSEEDISGEREQTGEKGFAILQIDFYGMLLGFLLNHTEL